MTQVKFDAALFNFADLSDLPEEIQGRLHRDSDDKAKEWAGIVQAAVEHGIPALSIAEVIAVASRAGITVPGDQTVRGYLNRAIELRLIGKPTRATYGAFVAGAPIEADTAGEDPVAEETDPLAGV